jgi:hypothetical protein
MMPKANRPGDSELSDLEVARRRDEVIKRMLNTPPKPRKDMKKAKARKQQGVHPTASEKRT